MEKKYYIYEIPGVKIGCTDNVQRRVQQQKCTQYKVLETHTDIYEASKRELELQRKYGYPVDAIPYYKTLLSGTTEGRIKAGKKGVQNGHLARIASLGGKKAVENGHLARIQSLGGKSSRKLTFEQAEQIREKFTKMDGGKLVRYDTLASEYNVSRSVILFIIQNRTYTEK
jgi:hypothetical protein